MVMKDDDEKTKTYILRPLFQIWEKIALEC